MLVREAPAAELEERLGAGEAPVLFHAVTPAELRDVALARSVSSESATVALQARSAEKLRSLLPSAAAWRARGDVLASLPDEAQSQPAALISSAADEEHAEEDTRGCTWFNLLAESSPSDGGKLGEPGSKGKGAGCPSLRWIIVSGRERSRAVAEWRRLGCRWPSAEELTAAGVDGVWEATQAVGQVLPFLPLSARIYARPA